MNKKFSLAILLTCNFLFADSLYEFASLENEKRFYNLIKEVRCPKCTSGSLASSNAPVSEDIKLKIVELIKEGKSDNEIKEYIVNRFGRDVLYDPSLDKSTYFLWIAPIFILMTALIIFFFRRKV